MIEIKDRVVHLADRHKDIPEHGTVLELFDHHGVEFANVTWDGSPLAVSHPIANLAKIGA